MCSTCCCRQHYSPGRTSCLSAKKPFRHYYTSSHLAILRIRRGSVRLIYVNLLENQKTRIIFFTFGLIIIIYVFRIFFVLQTAILIIVLRSYFSNIILLCVHDVTVADLSERNGDNSNILFLECPQQCHQTRWSIDGYRFAVQKGWVLLKCTDCVYSLCVFVAISRFSRRTQLSIRGTPHKCFQ